jgi:hypothetical protein
LWSNQVGIATVKGSDKGGAEVGSQLLHAVPTGQSLTVSLQVTCHTRSWRSWGHSPLDPCRATTPISASTRSTNGWRRYGYWWESDTMARIRCYRLPKPIVRWGPGVGRRGSGVRRRGSGVGSRGRCRAPGAGCRAPGAGRRAPGVGCRVPGAGRPDTRIPEPGAWIGLPQSKYKWFVVSEPESPGGAPEYSRGF